MNAKAPSLAELLNGANLTRKNKCKVATVVAALEEADAEAALAAINNNAIRIEALTVVLKKAGLNVSSESIRRHRTNICICVANGEA